MDKNLKIIFKISQILYMSSKIISTKKIKKYEIMTNIDLYFFKFKILSMYYSTFNLLQNIIIKNKSLNTENNISGKTSNMLFCKIS